MIQSLVEAYCTWLKTIQLDEVSSDKTKDGIRYSLNRQKALCTFLEDGEVLLDNNATEGVLRSSFYHFIHCLTSFFLKILISLNILSR